MGVKQTNHTSVEITFCQPDAYRFKNLFWCRLWSGLKFEEEKSFFSPKFYNFGVFKFGYNYEFKLRKDEWNSASQFTVF